jgi:hypothetical protein
MKNKDQILLEQAYLKIIKENEDKFQPHDPEMQELSKIGMGEEYPEEENLESNEWTFIENPDDPRSILSNKVFIVDGKKAVVKIEEDGTDDDMWYNYSFVDPETKEHVANMNWGRDGLTYQDVLDYIKLGLPSGVSRKSEKSSYPTRFNLDSITLKKFINGTAEREGLELIPRGK